jgi:hypothetical protein
MAFTVDDKAPAFTENAPVIAFQQFAESGFLGRL